MVLLFSYQTIFYQIRSWRLVIRSLISSYIFLVISPLIRSIYEQKLSDDLLSDQIEEINIVRSLLVPRITEEKYFGGRLK